MFLSPCDVCLRPPLGQQQALGALTRRSAMGSCFNSSSPGQDFCSQSSDFYLDSCPTGSQIPETYRTYMEDTSTQAVRTPSASETCALSFQSQPSSQAECFRHRARRLYQGLSPQPQAHAPKAQDFGLFCAPANELQDCGLALAMYFH